MNQLFETIKTLCAIDGISGREQAVGDEVLKRAREKADEAYRDKLYNIIAFKKGKKTPKNRIMLAAHMDEVGMIVTSVTEEGLLRLATVGGISKKVIPGRRVTVSDKKIPGTIGAKAVHQADGEEREKALTLDSLYIDIGAKDKEEALSTVSLGDSVFFVGEYRELGSNSILSKALDDRIGCAILLELMETKLEFDTWFLFSVQEELGTRGAAVGTRAVEPDIAIVVDVTASGDVCDVTEEKRVTVVGDGAVISFMDRSTIYDKALYELAFALGKEKGISLQTKTMIAGGNDAGAIHVSGRGVRTVSVSIPGKYIHSPSCVADKRDILSAFEITKALAESVGEI